MNRREPGGTDHPRILFIYPGKSSFVKEDLRILGRVADLQEFPFSINRGGGKILLLFQLVWRFLHQFFWLIRHREADLVYCWFADYHSFLPVWFAERLGVPSVTVLGGVDCIAQPKLRYGVYTSTWRKPLATYVVRHSSLLLPVDKTLIRTDPVAQHWPEAHPNGLTANVKPFDTPWRAVPTGYDPGFWKPGGEHRIRSVCTVSICNDLRTARRKGIDLVIRTAAYLPEVPFHIIGLADEVREQLSSECSAGDNIRFTDVIPRRELNRVYGESSVYLQLSRAEGLPNVLCEAMMCGCIPVGSAVFGIPHGIGDTGFVAEVPDPQKISELVVQALQAAPDRREEARKRVVEQFSLERRRRSLEQVLSERDLL